MKDMKDIDYISNYVELHANLADYGATTIRMLEEISLAIDYIKPKTVLDFGCGKGTALAPLKERYPDIMFYGYDPAIPGIDTLPVQRADLIINTDVLEHIPEDMIDEVLQQMAGISKNVLFGLDHTEAVNVLPNGQNAHCTIKPLSWYLYKINQFFPKQFVLPGRFPWKNVVLTFPLRQDLVNKYYRVTKIIPEQYVAGKFKSLVKAVTMYAKRIDELERELSVIKGQLGEGYGENNN